MTGQRRTPQDAARKRAIADAATGWCPQRGDLAHDTARGRVGVIVALPDDTGAHLYHLRPAGGGDEWAARRGDLQPHPDGVGDGLTLDEAAMPQGDDPEPLR